MPMKQLQLPYPDFQMGELIDPEQHDLNNLYVQNKINEVITIINQITDSVAQGGSGADIISLTPITPFTSNKVQSFLNEVITRLRSTANGTSGADLIASTTITGVTGNTVQAQLASLKALFDAEKTRVNSLVNTEIINVKNLITTERNRIDVLNTTSIKHANSISSLDTQMKNHNHDTRYMTRTELMPYLQGGDTQVFVEVVVIRTLDNGNGTFSYYHVQKDAERIGKLGVNGEMIFNLELSTYTLGKNYVKATINDTLQRSVASGGLIEVSINEVALVYPESIGTEITIEYFHRIGVTGEHNIYYSTTPPPPTSGSTMWFKVVQ